MKKELETWVFGDHRNYPHDHLTSQVLGQARSLSKGQARVTVVLLGDQVEKIAKEYVAHGAHRVLLVDHPELAFYRADLFTAVICDLIQEHQPDIFLLGASDFGKELAARIAKRLGVGLCADCVALDWNEEKEKLIASSPAFGGNFLARIAWNTRRPFMATVGSGTFHEQPYDETASGEVVRIEKKLDGAPSKISVLSSLRESQSTAKLDDAKIVVAGGRGVKNLEGFNLLRELALLLGGRSGRPGRLSMSIGLRMNT